MKILSSLLLAVVATFYLSLARAKPTIDEDMYRFLLSLPRNIGKGNMKKKTSQIQATPKELYDLEANKAVELDVEAKPNADVLQTYSTGSTCPGTFETVASQRVVKIYNTCAEKNDCLGLQIKDDLIITAAHCIFDVPVDAGSREKAECKTLGCFEVRSITDDSFKRTISHPIRHYEYKKDIDQQTTRVNTYRYDLAVIKLNKDKISPTTQDWNCYKKECLDKKEECRIYRLDGQNHVYHTDIKVSECRLETGIEYFGCHHPETLCITDASGGELTLQVGESGSPIICQETGEKGTSYHVRGILSQIYHDNSFALIASINHEMLRNLNCGCSVCA